MRPAVQTFQNDAWSTPITGPRIFWDTQVHGPPHSRHLALEKARMCPPFTPRGLPIHQLLSQVTSSKTPRLAHTKRTVEKQLIRGPREHTTTGNSSARPHTTVRSLHPNICPASHRVLEKGLVQDDRDSLVVRIVSPFERLSLIC